MSREIRRVPVDWRHPTEPNPYWREQQHRRALRDAPKSRLHAPDTRFVPLMAQSLSDAQREWDEGAAAWADHDVTHPELKWLVEYHLTGFDNRFGQRQEPALVYVYADDGETLLWQGMPTDVAELVQRRPWTSEHGERPTDGYMPDFDECGDDLGWCLYETVSEGSPVTPVFATAQDLVEHLVQHGEARSGEPYRREAAERLVSVGSSFGSFVLFGSQVFDGARDADLIAKATS